MNTQNNAMLAPQGRTTAQGAANPARGVYRPGVMLDAVLDRLQLKNDAQLCRELGIAPPIISKVRNFHAPVGAALMIRLHEISGLTIQDLRWLIGDHGESFKPVSVEAMYQGKLAAKRAP